MLLTKKSALRETLRRVRDGLEHDSTLIGLRCAYFDMCETAGFSQNRCEELATYTMTLAAVMHGIFSQLVTKPHEPDKLRSLVQFRTAVWSKKAGQLWQLGYNETQFMASVVVESVCEAEGCSKAAA